MRVNKNVIFYGMTELSDRIKCHGARSNFFFWGGGLSGSENIGGGDNTIQFINIGRVGDKSFKE